MDKFETIQAQIQALDDEISARKDEYYVALFAREEILLPMLAGSIEELRRLAAQDAKVEYMTILVDMLRLGYHWGRIDEAKLQSLEG